jgi:hypothetical protein
MKPNFALNLTHEAIVLLHRTARGWLAIGEAAIDSADLAEALGYLRASAFGLSPQGVTTKLILPNSQILYTEVDAPGPDAPARRRQVAAALEGRTPYAVEDLVFDIWGKGPRVQVAVVARETLEEAEAFIDQHRFNPVSFVAIPPAGAFGGEPFFGQTQAAARVLAAGESVARDQDPVSIVTRDGAREDGAARPARDAAKAAGAGPDESVPTKSPPPVATGGPAAARSAEAGAATETAAEPAAPTPAAAPEAAPVPKAAAPVAPAPDAAPAATLPTTEPVAAPTEATASSAEPPSLPVVSPDATVTPSSATLTEPVPEPAVPPPPTEPAAVATRSDPPAPPPKADPPAAKAPEPVAASPAMAPVAQAQSPVTGAAAAPPETPAPPEAPPVPSFASRRREAPAAPPAPPAAPPSAPRLTSASLVGAAPAPGPATARSPGQFAAAPPLAAAPAQPPLAPPPAARPAATRSADAPRPAVQIAPEAAPPRAALSPGLPPPPPPIGARAQAAAVPPFASTEIPAKPSSAGAASRLRPDAARIAATVPPPKRGARPQPAPAGDGSLRPGAAAAVPGIGAKGAARTRGKPRYLGLALTGALLVFLMLVAAYSSFIVSRDDTGDLPDTDVAAAPEADPAAQPAAPAPVIVTAGDAVEPEAEMLADLAEAEALPEPAPEPEPSVAEAIPEPEATVEAAAPPEAEPEAAPPPAAVSGDTDVALSTASAATGQDEIFLSAVDAPPPAFDAVALPAPVAGPDAAPGTTAPPPPFGTVYRFDDAGRILADTTGVVAPGGFWLIAARPPVVPPARPALATPDPAVPDPALVPPVDVPDPALDPATPEQPLAAGGFAPDTTVTPRRPQVRPAGLVAPLPDAPETADPQQADDDAALTRDDPRHADLRPRARSPGILARAAEAALARQAEDEARALANASLVAAAVAEATPVAMNRPANASPLAVPLSRRPAARPRDFTRAVAAAAAEASQPRPPAEPEGQAATPEEEPEPEVVATAAPRIPTRANVAKQATFANAINLSKVNLIGIYGTPSNRYAMVRTSGGRFTRVKVGDRVDGGTVAAITASEVRYKKGGRMLTLAMPRG